MQKLENSLIISLFSFFYVLDRDKEAYMQYHKIVQLARARYLRIVQMFQLEELVQNRIESTPQTAIRIETPQGALNIREVCRTKE